MQAAQRGGYVGGGLELELLGCQGLLVVAATGGGGGVGGAGGEVREEEGALFALGGFGVALGCDLRATELLSRAVLIRISLGLVVEIARRERTL